MALSANLNEPSPRTTCLHADCPSDYVIFTAGGGTALHWPLVNYDHNAQPAETPADPPADQ